MQEINSPASKRVIRAAISLTYGALAGICAVFADAAIPTCIGVALGISGLAAFRGQTMEKRMDNTIFLAEQPR